jgi:hypothetical protein
VTGVVKRPALAAVVALHTVVSIVGIDWGLPSRGIDKYLFGDGEPWSGDKIARLASAADKFSVTRGADVDADPLDKTDGPIPLTGTDEKVAAIYLRYRLYTHQPDEMITMMALSQMRPGSFDFDPRMYQYGGLFVYPVGALVRLCGIVGLIDVRSDLVFYLDHPDEFGKFYIVARAYVAAWGLIGVLVVYGIARRLGDHWAAVLAALLFTLLPVVVCMSHEAKPHLPGAVLMLAAVLFAVRYVELARRRDWWRLAIACGAAFGMVLSSLPIFILIPLVELARFYSNRSSLPAAIRRATAGVAVALGIYAISNPYVPVNLLVNRQVLTSNLRNSTAMYEIDRVGEGFARMLALTEEGATLPVLLIGLLAVVFLVSRRRSAAVMLLVPAGLFFVQFVLLGAGKPAEYGRFGVFVDIALAVATACVLVRRWAWLPQRVSWMPAVLVVLWVGFFGYRYLYNFVADASMRHSRLVAAEELVGRQEAIAVLAEPAPYSFPPVNFARRAVWLLPPIEDWIAQPDVLPDLPAGAEPWLLLAARDRPTRAQGTHSPPGNWEPLAKPGGDAARLPAFVTPVSWANKPICCWEPPGIKTISP